ncbi:MAG: acetyl-CoA carboxylase biotin carboxylase subunit [Candidatus Omnitrophota bacterium]|nr:acetyl-CoA carboxylase biotin carboxylase subunit [Candidatus Omnitrophota bacterium]
MFNKVLIANRGEVALRIIRACREMGIKTVAVYSTADKDSLHVRLADQAVCIGPAPSKESYLNIPAIISAAEITDVQAIHPGYGFLAENPHFAEICQSCQIKFIGPGSKSVVLMGDKTIARKTAKKAGISTVPGSDGVVKTKDEAIKIAKRLKYPVIIKARLGGGGKGMRVAHNDGHLISSLMTAQREAEASFGAADIYIEKYIEGARHVEIQILGDNFGNIVHLGERDCSIQRKHQKLIEESPSPIMTAKLRKKMGEAAVKCARIANYTSAGTVEFLVDKKNNYFFIEMNTRIQVEHPVTEMVTGIDLLKKQIKIAWGEKLRTKQSDIKIKGCAIECRINAEDPERNFIPCPGKITKLNLPGGRGIRIDTHVYPGYEISPYYDSMIGKLITYGKNRSEAIHIMRRALKEFIIEPVKTTLPLHKKILENPDFLKGRVHTAFIEKLLEKG